MQLTEFVRQVTLKFAEETQLHDRLQYAAALAKNYKFVQPELVLCYTHPELAKLALPERLKKLNMTEEQFALLSQQDGFQRFLRDWQNLAVHGIRAQSVEKLAEAIPRSRTYVDKMGNVREDFSIELETLRGLAAEKAPAANPQINLKFNLWERARAKAAEMQPAVPTTATSSE